MRVASQEVRRDGRQRYSQLEDICGKGRVRV